MYLTGVDVVRSHPDYNVVNEQKNSCKPCHLLPAYGVVSEVNKDIHLPEQWTISQLNSL